MLLTRLGWNPTMVVMGDPDQTDLLPGMAGLQEIADLLDPFDDVAITWFSNEDVVRYPLVPSWMLSNAVRQPPLSARR